MGDERVSCDLPALCKPLAHAEGWWGRIIERSATELRLNLIRRYEKDTSMSVAIKDGSTILVSVLDVQASESGWLLDCKILTFPCSFEVTPEEPAKPPPTRTTKPVPNTTELLRKVVAARQN